MLVLHLHAAAQHLDEVRDNLALKNPGVVRLQAVQNLASNRHNPLIVGVPGQLHAAQGGVALHNIDFPAFHILRPAIHELLDPVGDVHAAGEFFLDVQPGLLGLFPAALVQQHLLGDLLRVKMVLNKVDLQIGPQKLRHGLLHELVGDGLFGLVLIGGLGGEVAADQDEAVLHVGPGDLALVFLILPLFPEILVNGGHKGGFRGLFRAAAVLQPA